LKERGCFFIVTTQPCRANVAAGFSLRFKRKLPPEALRPPGCIGGDPPGCLPAVLFGGFGGKACGYTAATQPGDFWHCLVTTQVLRIFHVFFVVAKLALPFWAE